MRSGSPSAGQGGRALRRACVPPYPVATAGGGGAQRLASYAHLEGEYAAARIVATATATLPPPAYEPPPRLVALSLRAYDGAFIYDLRHFLRQVPHYHSQDHHRKVVSPPPAHVSHGDLLSG